ncbi:Protein kinase-like domain [Cordyceps militaris CM01]|uniref:Protein kinase-like domain n=1 Tax=Cordyceps militaris (strain CM01) TaxID=983644 RepID=G3JTF6_CORMM|nr:Protein kinase-like domain [Cordyceps militaris CM01]EGX88303.1 Protein kinase-like domain [Cordyceps militaris CM01]
MFNYIAIGVPKQAFFVLRPSNAAAQLAFSDVVDYVQQQQQDEVSQRECHHIAKFLWLDSERQVASDSVARLLRYRSQMDLPGSSSPQSPGGHMSSVDIWMGGYFIDLSQSYSKDWSFGRHSSKLFADLVVTRDKLTHVSRKHAILRIDSETRLAFLKPGASEISVNSVSGNETTSRLALRLGTNVVEMGELRFDFEYTEFSRTDEATGILSEYLTDVYGSDSQPPPESISATPTPSSATKIIGSYVLNGILGAGTFGSVRPATGIAGNKILAIKSIVTRPNISAEPIATMEELTRRLDSSTDENYILRLVESFRVAGNLNEVHLVLEPFTPITLEKIPVQTQ